MQLRAWTTIFILSSSLLIACGDNSEGGDSAGSDAAAAGGDGGSGDDGGDGEPADAAQCTMQDDCGGGGEGKFICHGAEDCPEAGDECCMPAEAMVGVCRANCGGPG